MDYSDIVNSLSFKYPQLVSAFGSINTFLLNLYAAYPYNVDNIVLTLLNKSFPITIIDFLNSRFLLYDLYEGTIDINNLVFEEPYTIYSFEGDVLYQVAYHNGVFGNSILDKALLLDHVSGSVFYLEYTTYTGKEILMIIKGLDTSNEDKNIGLTSTISSTLVQQEQNNIIQLTLVTGGRNMTTAGLPYYPIELYYLPTSSLNILNSSVVINSSLSIHEEYNPNTSSNMITFSPTNSGWLTLTQNTGVVQTPLYISNITGAGSDRFLTVAPNLYYVVLDSDINLSLVRHAFNINSNPTTSQYASYTNLNLQGQLNNN